MMNEFFGIPIGPFATTLVVLFAAIMGILAVLALRNRVFLRLGVRNVTRRGARTALIVLGLMLGTTIISSALVTGDTMSHTIRSAAVEALGSTDVLVSVKGAEVSPEEDLGSTTGIEYFPESVLQEVGYDLTRHENLIDGVAPAIIESLAVQNLSSRQSEPRVTMFASEQSHLAAFGDIRSHAGGDVQYLNDLRPGEIYLNADGADDLQAKPGDRLRLFAEGASFTARVREIVDYKGTGTTGPALIMPLHAAQSVLDRPGQIRYVMVSAQGDELGGAKLTDRVIAAVNPTLRPFGLEADPVKQDALDEADAEGNAFMAVFTTFGSFSIFAGAMLIFLIFVMLAAERRGELGIARAVGTRRGHLIQMYLYEGMAYDLAAALVGALIGVAVAFGMVFLIASALDFTGVEIQRDVRFRSLVVAYLVGVLLTFLIVTFSAWRVSRLNIVAAIRNTPEPRVERSRKRRWIPGALVLLLGVLVTASGVSAADAVPFLLGLSLVILGIVPLARAAGLPERPAFSVAGIAMVVLWLLPFDTVEALAGRELKWGMAVWIMSGIFVVVGAAWVMIFNADILLGALTATVGRIRAFTPVLRMAIAYPLRNRFRTGVTFAMFTLVVFTMVVGAVVTGSFVKAFDDPEKFGGGFDIRAQASPTNPVSGMDAAIRHTAGLDPAQFTSVSEQSFLAAKARQVGRHEVKQLEDYGLRGLDDTFLHNNTFGFAARARGYTTDREIWQAVAAQPRLAVIDSVVVPRRDNWGVGAVLPDFKLQGFLLEDGVFEPIPVATVDPQTGKSVTVTVIGVLEESVPEAMYGISTSQRTLAAAYGHRVWPTAYYFAVAPGADATALAPKLEAAFVANGLEADSMEKIVDDALGVQLTFNRIVEGFMGLGLFVGIAALGVISARAVVERRQQIGILRALGFQKRTIQLSFLIESSFIALSAIVVGTGLALIISKNVIDDVAATASWQDLALVVPWLHLALIFGGVYAAALLATLAPAVRASRIYPAEALRYE
jgi:putative ABC transport system permease protein